MIVYDSINGLEIYKNEHLFSSGKLFKKETCRHLIVCRGRSRPSVRIQSCVVFIVAG